MQLHDFTASLNYTNQVDIDTNMIDLIARAIPGVNVHKSNIAEDKLGTDYWVPLLDGRRVSVDVKNRNRINTTDDLCLELISVYKDPFWPVEYPCTGYLGAKLVDNKVGWTIDPVKQTNYIIYTWPTAEGKRTYEIFDYVLLRAVTTANAETWLRNYPHRPVFNRGYRTICVFPPVQIVRNAMSSMQRGIIG